MKILFTSSPLVGHLFPMFPLMRAARSAGHKVIVATGRDMVSEVERRGYQAWPVGPTGPQAIAAMNRRYPEPADDELGRIRRAASGLFAGPGIARAREMLPLGERWQPDLVIRDLTEPAGSAVSYATGAREITHGYGTRMARLRQLTELIGAEVGPALHMPDLVENMLDSTYLDPCPPLLHPGSDKPFRFVQPVRPETGDVRLGDRLPEQMSDFRHDRTVYLTLGTVFRSKSVFTAALAGLADLAVNVVVTLGREMELDQLGKRPANVAIASFVPQALILPHCDAVVSHGGSGTMLGAACHGLPQVFLPQGADQFANAEAVSEAGAGLALLPDQVSAEAVRAAVSRVLQEPSFSLVAGQVRDQIESMPSAGSVLSFLAETTFEDISA
jgi:UDP:flavonoid glycosyltransferase YjiC (YdhE family)